MSVHEATGLVQAGDTLALGGMTLYRRPVAFVRELNRRGKGDLTLLTLTAGYESDLLVGAPSQAGAHLLLRAGGFRTSAHVREAGHSGRGRNH